MPHSLCAHRTAAYRTAHRRHPVPLYNLYCSLSACFFPVAYMKRVNLSSSDEGSRPLIPFLV